MKTPVGRVAARGGSISSTCGRRTSGMDAGWSCDEARALQRASQLHPRAADAVERQYRRTCSCTHRGLCVPLSHALLAGAFRKEHVRSGCRTCRRPGLSLRIALAPDEHAQESPSRAPDASITRTWHRRRSIPTDGTCAKLHPVLRLHRRSSPLLLPLDRGGEADVAENPNRHVDVT